MEHRLELDAPRVAGWSLAVRVDQYGNAAVDGLGDFRVAPRAEDRARSRIGIQQPDVGGAEGNVPIPVFQLFDPVSKEDEIGLRGCRLFAAKVEDAELEDA